MRGKAVRGNSSQFSEEEESSASSSLSSIPIKDLKRIMAMTTKVTTVAENNKVILDTSNPAKNSFQTIRHPKSKSKPQKSARTKNARSKNCEGNDTSSSTGRYSGKGTNPLVISMQKGRSNRRTENYTSKRNCAGKLKAPPLDVDHIPIIDAVEEEEAACCLCHCGVDCSDRALFFPKDRTKELQEDDKYYFSLDDPYLPESIYDPNNALVYCDTCNRLYHQKCHFVPLLVIPRGDWNCLLCSLTHQQKSSGPKQPWRQFCKKDTLDAVFISPSSGKVSTKDKEMQEVLERVTALPKAQLWQRQLSQLRTFLKSQAGNIRMASAALSTLTSTKRNRAHFSHSKKSQELAQTLVRLATSKWKIRSALLSLEDYRLRDNTLSSELIGWAKTHSIFLPHVFPHGKQVYETSRRMIPRTKEWQDTDATTNGNKGERRIATSVKIPKVPVEISIPQSTSNAKRTKIVSQSTLHNRNNDPATISLKGTKKEDDDSGISLDDLKCCVCFIGDATDENDLLLCDGQGCCRAFHMHCISPPVMNVDDDNWFCPLCCAISNLTAEIQVACMDEDWDHRRETEKFRHLESSSLLSWNNADDVFPEAEWEFFTANKFKEGKQNDDTVELLRVYLGDDFIDRQVIMPVGSDSEDENDYSLFDEESLKEKQRHELGVEMNDNESDSNADSTHSSQATLMDLSSVELNIDKSELAALSDGGASSSSSVESSIAEPSIQFRRSRRLRRSLNISSQSSAIDPGPEFDERNIIEGKRKRKEVDYRKLNDALFGDLSANEQATLDDEDNYELQPKKEKPKGTKATKADNREKRRSHSQRVQAISKTIQ